MENVALYQQKITDLVRTWVSKLHYLIFGTAPGEITKRFLKNLSFAMVGTWGATLVTFGFNIWVVRQIGPGEFGKWNLIGSVAEFLAVFPTWGLTVAALRYLGAERARHQAVMGTIFRTVLLLAAFFFPTYFFLQPYLAPVFHVEASLYVFALAYSLASLFFYLFQSFFQGMEMFRELSVLWIGSAFIFAGTVWAYLSLSREASFLPLFWGNFWRLLLIVAAGLVVFRKALAFFDRALFREVFAYGTYNLVGAVAGFFTLAHIDNLLINYFLGPAAVGLYAAYYAGFSIFTSKILTTYSQVFLPIASGYPDLEALFRRVIRGMKRTGAGIFGANLLLIWLLFCFYGEKFAFSWSLASLMALSITLYTFLFLVSYIIAATGTRGAKLSVKYLVPAGPVLNVALDLLLITQLHLAGAVIATIATTTILLLIALSILRRLIRELRPAGPAGERL